MCPMCIATTAWVAAGAAGTGGVSLLALRRWRAKTAATIAIPALFAVVFVGTLVLAAVAQAAPTDDVASCGRDVESKTAASTDATRTGYAKVEDGRIYYQVHSHLHSSQRPLLILHGAFMTAESMAPLVERFDDTRPVIVIAQRGHGRTGDLPGGLTYTRLADDAAAVLKALGVPVADVLGYSMGGTAAIAMAIRHPDRVDKQVIVSAAYRRDGWHQKVLEFMDHMTPEMFAGTPLVAAYRRLSPTPDAFPTLVKEIKALEARPYGWSEADVRAIDGKTMIIVGDTDAVELAHALKLFKLRGGENPEAIAKGFMTESPEARLAVLPATAHITVMARAALIVALVTPFLEDTAPPLPEGFFD